MANIYSGNNTGKSLPVTTGRFEESIPAATPITSIVITDSAVKANNTIVYSIETESAEIALDPIPNYISARVIGTSFTITIAATNNGASANSIFVNYAIF
jgi:hypothetical protein